MKFTDKFKQNKSIQIFQYSLIKYIALGFGLLKGIINAKFLGPDMLGILGNLMLILGYCSYLNLGILNSMNREYILNKDKNKQKAKNVINTTFTFLFMLSILLCIFGISAIVLYKNNFGVYLMLVFIIAIFEQFRNFFTNYYRLINNYRMINFIEVIYSIIAFILTVLLIINFEIYGVLFSMLICGGIIFFLGIFKIRTLKLTLDKNILKNLIMIGIPLLIYNLGFHILSTIDRVIIINNLTEKDLGYYTFANSMAAATLVFVSSLLFLLYPKVIREFNEKESSDILRKINIYTKILEIGSVILIIIGTIVLEPFIKIFLTQYMESIGVYMILILAITTNNLAYFSNCYIVSNNKQKYLVYFQILSIVINYTLNIFFVNIGLGIKGIALGTLITNLIYSILQYCIFIKLSVKKIDLSKVIKIYSKIIIFMSIQLILVFLEVRYILSITIIMLGASFLYWKDFFNIKKYISIIK